MRRLLLLSMFSVVACKSPTGSQPANGEMAAQWGDSTPAGFRARATALWCARDSLLELIAVRNDTAVGFALLPKDTLRAGTYSVFPSQVFGAFRPQAAAGVRWLDAVELKGFEGTSGAVTVTEAGAAGVSGTFDVLLRRSGASDTLRVGGSFARVPVGPAIESCGRANRAAGG